MKEVIVFDMDGVIFDSVKISSEYLMSRFEHITEKDIQDLYLGNFHQMMSEKNWKRRDYTDEERLELAKRYQSLKAESPLYAGMKELTEQLSSTYTLALNTSAMESTCLPLLNARGMQEYFSFLGTKEVSRSKVEKFSIIAREFGGTSGSMLFVTDTVGDIKEAQEAGIPTIAVCWGAHTKEHFDPYVNILVAVVENPRQLGVKIHDYFRNNTSRQG